MKKILIVLLVALLILGLVGCRKARENAVENMMENMIEAQSGEDVDIDINDDGADFSISSDDGDINMQGDESGMAWPNDKLPNNVPEVKGVKVIFVMDAGTGVSISFEGCTAQIAADYEQKMIKNGWEITMSYESEGFHTITAQNSNDEMLQFSWDEEDGTGGIIYGTNE